MSPRPSPLESQTVTQSSTQSTQPFEDTALPLPRENDENQIIHSNDAGTKTSKPKNKYSRNFADNYRCQDIVVVPGAAFDVTTGLVNVSTGLSTVPIKPAVPGPSGTKSLKAAIPMVKSNNQKKELMKINNVS